MSLTDSNRSGFGPPPRPQPGRGLRALEAAEDDAAHRADQTAALYRFTDRLYRAQSVDDIYDAALDAITTSLGCRRASILLFDEAGRMRFVAQRGLSSEYCASVDGHSPWVVNSQDPQPICVPDVAHAELGELKASILREGIGACAFIPLTEAGQLIGKFMAYYDTPHGFSPDEIDLALMLARQLGFAVERSRDKERFRLIFERAGVGAALLSADGCIVQANDAFAAISGRPPHVLRGHNARDFTHADDVAAFEAALHQLAHDGGPVAVEQRYGAPSPSKFVRMTLSLVADHLVLAVAEDVTERRRSEMQRTLLIHELNHRVKNTLATVQSLSAQTFRNPNGDRKKQAELLEQRLGALARAHDLLTQCNWESAQILDLAHLATAPFATDPSRFSFAGPNVTIQPKQALALAIALHELATNAAKYGALSIPEGRVNLRWRVDGAHCERLTLHWNEAGGPPVRTPTESGFGLRLLQKNLANDLGGEVEISFAPDGVKVRIALALQQQTS